MAANIIVFSNISNSTQIYFRKNMNKLNKSLMATLLVGSVLTPVFAEQKQATETLAFEAVDYEALFESESKAVEVAALSTEEMKETEGSFLWFLPVIGYTALGAGSGAVYSYARNDGNVDWRDVGAGATGGFYASPVGRVVGGMGYGAGYLIGAAGAESWYSNSFNSYSGYGSMYSPSGAGYGGSGVGYMPY